MIFHTPKLYRRRIVFHGRVQAVGFRYVATIAADNNRATGWVRNEYDGTVTMEIQGTEEQISKVLLTLQNARHIEIDDMEVRELSVVENEKGFRVRY